VTSNFKEFFYPLFLSRFLPMIKKEVTSSLSFKVMLLLLLPSQKDGLFMIKRIWIFVPHGQYIDY